MAPDPDRKAAEQRAMDQSLYLLDALRQSAVLRAMQEVCAHHGWTLLAAHVRTKHVHAVVRGDLRPEQIMNAFKAYATRLLNEMKVDTVGRKRWARHGSTRWLSKPESVSAAIRYVIDEQGEKMAVWSGNDRSLTVAARTT